MAAYRRKSFVGYNRGGSGKTDVSITWNNMLGVYDVKFNSIGDFSKVQNVLNYIKTQIPYGIGRDYDPDTKVWNISEQFIQPVLIMLRGMPQDFNVHYTEKPVYQAPPSFNTKDIQYYRDKFAQICGLGTLQGITLDEAKNFYRKAALKLHPDRNPGNAEAISKMYELNEAWMNLKTQHFVETVNA